MKKILATLGILGSLGAGGTIVADRAVNPYTETTQKYEIVLEQRAADAGDAKVQLSKDSPEVTLSKWDNEANLIVRPVGDYDSGSRAFLSNRIEWKSQKQEVHAYPLSPAEGMEDGGFEVEIVLNEKPDTNEFNFEIKDAAEFDFFYQPPLWQEAGLAQPTSECDDTHCVINGDASTRAENIVGSYAVYHKTLRNNIAGEKNYATGKAFHILRPKAIDASGNESWADMAYQDGVLKVTVSQKFLDTANYPVRVDPSFGYTTVGGTTSTLAGNTVRGGGPETPTFSGTVNTIFMYDGDATNSGLARGVLYASTTLALVDVGTEANLDAPAGGQWLAYDMDDQSVTAGTTYLLGFWIDATTFSNIRRDVVASYNLNRDDLTYHATNPPNDPFVVDSLIAGGSRWSIYAGITPASSPGSYQVVNTYTGSATFVAPPGITTLDKVEAWGAGGGGSTNVGGGGGGAYAATTSVTVVPGANYSVVVGTSAANSNGGDSTFNSTTVVADGGLSGTNGGTGGSTANSTGATEYAGGNGLIAAGDAGGGGGAGATGAGSNGSTSGAATPGTPDGGPGGDPTSDTSAGKMFGGGGISRAAIQTAGATGGVRITYTEARIPGFAAVVGRSYDRDASDATSRDLTMPSGITAGELLIAIVSSDGAPTVSMTGWTKLGQVTDGTSATTQAVFYKTAAGSDTGTVTTSSSEQTAHTVLRIKDGGTPTGTSASGTSGSANPPSHNTGASGDYLWIVGSAVDGTLTVFVGQTAAPATYGDLMLAHAEDTGGISHAVADLQKTIQTEDPGTFTHASQEWSAWTIAVPYSAPGGGTPDSGPAILYLKNSDFRVKDADVRVKE